MSTTDEVYYIDPAAVEFISTGEREYLIRTKSGVTIGVRRCPEADAEVAALLAAVTQAVAVTRRFPVRVSA